MLALLMLHTKPARRLSARRPTDNLFSPEILASIIGQMVIAIVFFVIVFNILQSQPWFCSSRMATIHLDGGTLTPLNMSEPDSFNYPCYLIKVPDDINEGLLTNSFENSAMWLFTHVMYVHEALAFSITTTFRRPFWTNLPYFFYLIFIYILLSIFLLMKDGDLGFGGLQYVFGIREGIPSNFRWELFILMILNGLIAVIVWEYWGVKFIHRWSKKVYGIHVKRRDDHHITFQGQPQRLTNVLQVMDTNDLSPLSITNSIPHET